VSTELVLFAPQGTTIAFIPEAQALKEAALERGALVGYVNDEATNAEATEALKALKKVLNAVEATRKRVKEPVLDMARLIDSTAKEFAAELNEEFARIQRACADYQTAQLERVREQERRRAEEAARIEREKQEALQKIEAEKQAAEAAARTKAEAELAAAKTLEDKIAADRRAKEESDRIRAEAEAKAKAEEERRQQEALTVAPTAAPVRAAGQTAKPTWCWEVIDIWTLARMQPGLVEITPRRQQINEVIESLAMVGDPKVPGLRIWQEVKVGVRTGRDRVVDV
jgi:DNA repair exonuclease SbcCD ATPase subunit